MCRLSIIVPYDRDEAAFEATLVSVLENRPEHCEVLVAHDGGYCDPFDLSDEVRFVVADSADPVALVRKAVSVSLGRIVHVLCDGARATEGWTEEPLALFEQAELATVAPVIRDLTAGGRIVAAGWRDTSTALRQPLASGSLQPSRREAASIQGSYLSASFWRRGTLDALTSIPVPSASGVADYVWSLAMRKAGWRCRVAPESSVVASPLLVRPTCGGFRAAVAMQSMRTAVMGQGAGGVCVSSLCGLATRPWAPAAWAHSLGRMTGSMQGNREGRKTLAAIEHFCETAGPDAAEARILSMPTRRFEPMRRAA